MDRWWTVFHRAGERNAPKFERMKEREKQKCVCNIGANRQVVAVIWGSTLIQLETVVGSSSDAQWVITDGAMPCNKWTLFGDSVWQWWLCQQSSVHSDNNNEDQHIGSKTRGTSQTELNWSVVVMHVVVVQYTSSYLGCGAFLLLLQFSSTLFLFHTLFFSFPVVLSISAQHSQHVFQS